MYNRITALLLGAGMLAYSAPASAQHQDTTSIHAMPHADAAQDQGMAHEMWSAELGRNWRLLGMAQVFPVVTVGAPGQDEDHPLRATQWYLTQPALMLNLEDRRQRVALRTTLNPEGVFIGDGELTFGGWGEGFIDKRHPHTLLHELMLSVNFGDPAATAFSVSAGKGFAPYGTDDPMARPTLKYPTNHHLSQILERWTLNAVVVSNGWSLEAGIFGGAEPEGPYDLSNIESFGDSWSARVARRWGDGAGPAAEWEASASYGSVLEAHHGVSERTALWNAALRHERPTATGQVYGLVEASRSDPEHGDGYFSVLGEARMEVGAHQPYARVEYATRPEYQREGAPGSDGFFRYHHDDEAVGATRWLIGTLAYAHEATGYPFSIRPFAEAQYHHVTGERGGIEPAALFGSDSFWSVSLGARVYIGGASMRMGAYGVLDAMTWMHRMMETGHETDHDDTMGSDHGGHGHH